MRDGWNLLYQLKETPFLLIRSKAPLRLGLAGGGTDVSPYCDLYGGVVLNATINMYAYCTLEPLSEPVLRFRALDRDEFFEASAAPLALSGELLLHKGVYNRVVRDFNGGRPLSLSLTTYSDAPAGSGLGSSSTMVVAMLKAYVEYLNLPLGDYDIASLAHDIERRDLGLSGGKQDQYAATFGGFNFMEFYGQGQVLVNPLRIKNWIRNELENSLLLYHMGTSRDSAKIIDEQIKNTREGCASALDGMHLVKESAYAMKHALLTGNFSALADCLRGAWEAKKQMAYAISNPQIEAVYDYAMSHGARAAKISGAGGGGFMMILCDPVNRYGLMRSLKKMGGEAFTTTFSERGLQAWTLY